jgi:hypothetical protein
MEPELFDFCSLNSRCREQDGDASRNTTNGNSISSSHVQQQRLPLPRRSYSDDMLQPRAHLRPSRARGGGGPKKPRRFIPPFKMIGGRGSGESTRGEAIGNSDHAIASVSSDSRTTLSSKSRYSRALHVNHDGEASAGPRKARADALLPFDSFAMTLSDIENDCISEVSVEEHATNTDIDDAGAGRARAQTHALQSSSMHRTLPIATMSSHSLPARPLAHGTRSSAPNQGVAFAEDVSLFPNRCRRVSTTDADISAAPAASRGNSSCPAPEMTMVEVVSGSFVPLIGTQDTLDAYRTGAVVDQACLGCNEFLLCSDRATLVICPVCRSIGPVGVAASADGLPTGVRMTSNLDGRGALLGLGLTVHMIESEILGLP